MAKGSCLCGGVSYVISGAMRPIIACHCQQCRKTSGHHVAATSVLRSRITIDGPITWYTSSKVAKRGFCATCGSNLFWDGAGKNISIFAGTLDTPTGLVLAGHIYCEDKGDYYEIGGDLPCATGWDASMTTVVQ